MRANFQFESLVASFTLPLVLIDLKKGQIGDCLTSGRQNGTEGSAR